MHSITKKTKKIRPNYDHHWFEFESSIVCAETGAKFDLDRNNKRIIYTNPTRVVDRYIVYEGEDAENKFYEISERLRAICLKHGS